MKWTREIPTVVGWYFKSNRSGQFGRGCTPLPRRKYSLHASHPWIVCEVYERAGILGCRYASQSAGTGAPLAWNGAEDWWYGPIVPPAMPEEATK